VSNRVVGAFVTPIAQAEIVILTPWHCCRAVVSYTAALHGAALLKESPMIADYYVPEAAVPTLEAAHQGTVEESTNLDWQCRFLLMVPSIRRHARYSFRGLSAALRDELLQEVIARACLDYGRLVQRGKEHVACAGPLARYAIAQIYNGRRVGSRRNVRDVMSEYCQWRKGVSLQSLDDHDVVSGDWQQILVEDRHSTPAEIASLRIDVTHWLTTLPARSRHLVKRLALGETTSEAARRLGISRGRVSQLRNELRRAWYAFQGELADNEM
jgi:DNA-directed RNA polymerase specialized sigma24 family protein